MTMTSSTPKRRSYQRRTEDQQIAELEQKIKQLEQKMQERERPDAQVLKEFKKIKRTLGKYSQVCVDNDRKDLSNSILAFLHTFEKQAEARPAESRPRPTRSEST